MEDMVMDTTFWKNKKVLVTGHTGFKGSWVSLWLRCMGANVIGYSLPSPTKPSLFEVARISADIVSVTGDVRDSEHFKKVILNYSPEIIFHMAAQSLVRYSYKNPVETYSTNVMGTVNILETVRYSGSVRVVIIVTSDKCYKNNEWLWGYRENEPMGGHDPYSTSKGCAELVTSSYINSYFSEKDYDHHGVAVASMRAGNVIGGGDWAEDRLIPDIMNALMEKRPVIIRNPNAIRPWQHVLEPLAGYLDVAEKLWESGPEFSGGWNFGPNDDDAKPVSWIVERIIDIWGNGACWELEKSPQPHEANYLKLDSTKAKRLLGWSPKLSLDKTLKWIIDWYQKYQQGNDMRDYTETQIKCFQNLQNSGFTL